MAANSKIEWTDHTFNPWRGCQKVAAGCKNCYAETRSNRFCEDFSGQRIRLSDAGWKEPLRWNRGAAREHASRLGPTPRPRVFCASLADVFEDWDGPIVDHNGDRLTKCPVADSHQHDCNCTTTVKLTMDDLRRDLFSLIDRTPWLDWLLLTKRPENIRRMWYATGYDPHSGQGNFGDGYRKNVWLLTSVSDQETADRNIPLLLKCRDLVPVLGVSAEPLLGPVDISPWLAPPAGEMRAVLPWLDWVIVGGESGPNARPCDMESIRLLVRQCRHGEVTCFVKQLGSNPFHGVKGGDIEECPEDIRVRQFPTSNQPEGE